MTKRRPVLDTLGRLAAAERAAFSDHFLAPVVSGGPVYVRVAGVMCRLRLDPGFDGWGVFRPLSPTAATLVRPATLAERQRYLAPLPADVVILCDRVGACWLGWPQTDHAPAGTARLRTVQLVEDAQRFDSVLVRSDGVQWWFDRTDGSGDPAAAAALREAFRAGVEPTDVRRRGLAGSQRAAYALAWARREVAERDRTGERLRSALGHAGAELRGYQDRGDVYRLEFRVDGVRHVSVIRKDDLTVRTAGICLNGEDQRFDLHSLIGVLREARGGHVPRVGVDNRGMDEETYFRIHPPGGG